MFLARDHGYAGHTRLAVIVLACCWLLAGNINVDRAQEIPRRKMPAPRTIVMPQQVVVREQATLAVIDAAGRLLPGVTLEISQGPPDAGTAGSLIQPGVGSTWSPPVKVTTDSTGRALFIAPSIPGPFIARISGTELAAPSVALTREQINAHRVSAGGVAATTVNSYPHVLAIRDRFAITGNGFHGAADLNHVFLGDQSCLVIAASPVSLVIVPGPHVPVGATHLRVSVDGHDAGRLPVAAVLLEFNGPDQATAAGGDGKLILRVHGTTEPVAVEVHNGSPRIIQLLHGNSLRLKTSGGEENTVPVELKFLSSGDYILTARLIEGDSGKTPRGN
jgi:hypothetical protein